MKLQKWANLGAPQVIAHACEMYAHLGARRLDPSQCVEVWRDDSQAGHSAVFPIEHGFLLGSAQEGLAVRVSEKWAMGKSADNLVATALHVQSCGEIHFTLRYRLGQLSIEFTPDATGADDCRAYFDRL